MAGVVEARGKMENHLGIEVKPSLLWKGWVPGKEYTKHLVLKNVKVRTQKLKFSMPASRFFSTIYPEPITLSAGTSFTLPVTFRPLEKNPYSDKITFHTNAGEFEVPIRAVLPEYNVSVPAELDVTICCVHKSQQCTFQLVNNSELETPFLWQAEAPFAVEPTDGVLEPHGTATCKVTFSPKAALVYQSVAVCKFGLSYKNSRSMRLQGIGKYPHLMVEAEGAHQSGVGAGEVPVSFGLVAVGSRAEKWITVRNVSKVDAEFVIDIEDTHRKLDSVFDCLHNRAIVPAMTAVRIPLMFAPSIVNATCVEYFTLQPHGTQIKTVIKCTGTSRGPGVRLATQLVNFGRVDIGESVSKTVTVINDTAVPAVLQFNIDCNHSVFNFRQHSGQIQPHSSCQVTVEFKPDHPINYYRRVVCLINNQAPLYLDVIGTCHSELVKPAVLKSKHVINFRRHVERGLSAFPPEQLQQMLNNGKLQQDQVGALMYTEAEKLEPYCEPMAEMSSFDEYFLGQSEMMNQTPLISADVDCIEFGRCDQPFIEPRTVNITNHTKGPVTMVWTSCEGRAFTISPSSADIPPLKSACFTVTFKPDVPNQLFACELEGFGYYKSQRDYRQVDDQTHCPPWCLTVTCTGDTFQPNNMPFLPSYELESERVIFPAVSAGESAYRTLVVYNTGSTPIAYDLTLDTDSIFAVKPMKGIIHGDFQIFTLKCSPEETKVYQSKLQMKMNADDNNVQDVSLCGSAESPCVYLPDNGEICFPSTCVGTTAQRSYSVKNVSRIPLRYEWKLSHKDEEILSVVPRQGLIHPNESQAHCWSFRPSTEDRVMIKPRLWVWSQGQKGGANKKKGFSVRVIGKGDSGTIKADVGYVDFGNVMVGTSSRSSVTLCNDGDCDIRYRLVVAQTVSQGGDPAQPCVAELSHTEGVIQARTRSVLEATVRPYQRCQYQVSVSYQLVTDTEHPCQHLCHLLVTGVYPTVMVTDIHAAGSAQHISKKHLWNLFSIDSLNAALDVDPSSDELKYSVKTRQSYRRPGTSSTRAIVDVNFGAAPVGADVTTVYLMVENSGPIPVEYSFLFPADLQMELEYWAETGAYDEDELHEMKVQNNRLFDVHPRSARLLTGQNRTVTLTYKHVLPGTDRLPVLLKINGGREILLNLVGVSVEPDRAYIHYPSNKHTFTPVQIGLHNTPKQLYELHNGGSVPVRFEVDCEPLEELRAENYDRYILKCLTPCGEIKPGRHLALEWEFTPLEARTYMVDVPIRIVGGETAVVTFTGIGYDERIMGDTMSVTNQMALQSVPSQQTLIMPGQTSFLSADRITFRNVPMFSRSRQAIFVINRHEDHVISYTWHVTNSEDGKYCNVAPRHGTVPPGECRMCRVTFTACGEPSFHDMDLVCEVVDETKMDEYRAEMSAWHRECQRQKVEFTITDTDTDCTPPIDPQIIYSGSPQPGSADTRQREQPSAGRLKNLRAICRANVEDDALPKYRTLPPIKQLPVDAVMYLNKFNKAMSDSLWEKPSPPDPLILHLGVTARTHAIPEFQANFPDRMADFYIDRCLSAVTEVPETADNPDEKEISCTELESDVMAATLANILRTILDDHDFVKAVENISNEPVPYFHQLTTPLPDLPSPPTSSPKQTDPQADEAPVESPQDQRRGESPPERPPSSPQQRSEPRTTSPEQRRESRTSSPPQQAEDARSLSSPQHGADARTWSAPEQSGDARTSPAAERLSSTPQRRPSSKDATSVTDEGEVFSEREMIKRMPEFGSALDCVLENTLMNILTEAVNGEFSITSRPRVIALPPKRNSHRQSSASQ